MHETFSQFVTVTQKLQIFEHSIAIMKFNHSILFLTLAVVSAVNTVALAQSPSISVGALAENKLHENRVWVAANSEYRLVVQTQGGQYSYSSKHDFVVFDANGAFKSQGEVDLKYKENDLYCDEVFEAGGKIWLLASWYEKAAEQRHFCIVPADPAKTSFDAKGIVEIGKMYMGSKTDMHGATVTVTKSPAGMVLVASVGAEGKSKGNPAGFWVFDKSMQKKWSKDYPANPNHVYLVDNAHLDDNGLVYVLRFDRQAAKGKGKKVGEYHVLTLQNGEVESDYLLPAAAFTVHHLQLVPDAKGNIHLAGFYGIKDVEGIAGTVSMVIPFGAESAGEWISDELPSEIEDVELSEKAQSKGKEKYGFGKLNLVATDEGALFIAEDVGTYYYTGANKQEYQGIRYGHVWLILFGADGNRKWGRAIIKAQKIDHPLVVRTGSITFTVNNGVFYAFFYDVTGNAQVEAKEGHVVKVCGGTGELYYARVNLKTGEFKRVQLGDKLQKAQFVSPEACETQPDGSILLLTFGAQGFTGAIKDVGTGKITFD